MYVLIFKTLAHRHGHKTCTVINFTSFEISQANKTTYTKIEIIEKVSKFKTLRSPLLDDATHNKCLPGYALIT